MIVYTCVTEGYDSPRLDIKNIEPTNKDPRIGAKEVKILGELLEEPSTIWCDGNIYIKDTKPIISLLSEYDVVVLEHPARNCIYEEAITCKQMKLDYPEKIDKQIKYYSEINYPRNNGLYACGILARNHTKEINKTSRIWLDHIKKFSWRDQISFPVVFKDVRIGVLKPNTGDFYNNEVYEIKKHLKTIRYDI